MRSIRIILVTVALLHGALYAVVMPPWQAPDEVAHFEYSHLLAALRRPISSSDDSTALEQDIIRSLYQFHAWTYRYQPPPAPVPQRLDQTLFGYSRTLDRFSLTYVVYAIASWPFLRQDIVIQLYAMRLASVVMAAMVVLLTFETARLVAPNRLELALAASGLLIFLPQHTFITATVSDGNLAELASSACIFLIVRMWCRGLNWWQVAASLVFAVAAILSKATAYFLVVLVLFVGPALVWRWQTRPAVEQSGAWRRVALGGLVIGGLGAVLIPVLLFVPPLHFISGMIGRNIARLADIGSYFLSLNTGGQFSTALWATFESFWATFGWMAVWLPQAVYAVLLCLTLVSLGSLIWHLVRLPHGAEPEKSTYAVLALAAVLAIAVLVSWFVFSPVGITYFQGRYIFGAIVPIAIILAGGWLALAPQRFQRQAAVAIVVAMMLFDAAAIFNLVWPYFYRGGLA